MTRGGETALTPPDRTYSLDRFAPPGGKSSISLGDYVQMAPPAARPASVPTPQTSKTNGLQSSPPVEPVQAWAAAVPRFSAEGVHVGLAVCQAASLKTATVSELEKLGELQSEHALHQVPEETRRFGGGARGALSAAWEMQGVG